MAVDPSMVASVAAELEKVRAAATQEGIEVRAGFCCHFLPVASFEIVLIYVKDVYNI